MKTMRGFWIAEALLLAAAMGPATRGWAQEPVAEIQQEPAVGMNPSNVAVLVQPDLDSVEGQEARQKVSLEIAARALELVKGKPYSAETTTESVQTLADGNRIVHRTVSKFYRDSSGRTRREQTFGDVDPEHSSQHEVKIFIDDPVSGSAFVLDPASKSADKVHRSQELIDQHNIEDDGARVMVKVVKDREEVEQGATAPMLIKFRDEHSAASQDEKRDEVKEDLGTRNVQGVDCKGTRTTITIAAGAIGNENPISIVTETWYAPAIAAVVQSTTEDPRYGKTTYQLTNVQLSEPSQSMFEPPADFKLSVRK